MTLYWQVEGEVEKSYKVFVHVYDEKGEIVAQRDWLPGLGVRLTVDWETGEVMYEEKWHNKGSVIYADGLLYIYEEKQGHVGLAEPDPGGFRLISSFRVQAGSGPHWAHMSVYNGKLLIRHGEALMVYDIKAGS